MYVEQVAKDAVTNMKAIGHLHLHDFINFNIQNLGSLIDM